MSEKSNIGYDREEQAKKEVGHTAISPGARRFLITFFLFLVFCVPAVQIGRDMRGAGSGDGRVPQMFDIFQALPESYRAFSDCRLNLFGSIFRGNSVLLKGINEYEDELGDRSILTRALLSPAQYVLTGLFNAGNEEAYPGRDGWLFYRPGVDYLTGPGFLEPKRLTLRAKSGTEWRRAPQPDPVLAILYFQCQLAQRDIELLVMPAPVKPCIYPDKFSSRFDAGEEALQNSSYERFIEELAEPELFFERMEEFLGPYDEVPLHKQKKQWYWPMKKSFEELKEMRGLVRPVRVFDTAPSLSSSRSTGKALYLKTDTHWTPSAVRLTAGTLASYVRSEALDVPEPYVQYERTPTEISNLGDIAVMMRLPEGQRLYADETVTVERVSNGNRPWRVDTESPVLFMGDSFANIYSLGSMNWGDAGGLIEQLSCELGIPLDAVVRNDAGANSTREMLSRDLARGRDRLEGKRLVIWEFAVRELAVGDWRLDTTPMQLTDREEGGFLAVEENETMQVRGTVKEAGVAPRPGTVPYKDHIVHVHLVDIETTNDSAIEENEALVAMYSMRDNVWTAAAQLRPGDELVAEISSYELIDAEQGISSINSQELDSDAGLEDPVWGELAPGGAAPAVGSAGTAGDRARSWLPDLLTALVVLSAVVVVLRKSEIIEKRREAANA